MQNNQTDLNELPNQAPAKPLVSVCIQTYNHEDFIAQCIEGALMQETDFEYEIIIGEDESTDNTREICLSYAKKHPEKIRLFLRREEDKIWVDGVKTGRFNFFSNFKAARGEFIAMCDGDDYWTDKRKLQKQIDVFKKYQDISICFHQVEILKDGKIMDDHITKVPSQISTIEDLSRLSNYIHTPTCVFRNNIHKLSFRNFNISPIGDFYMHMMNAQFGKIYCIEEKMAVYRIHANSLWSSKKALYRKLKILKTKRAILLDLTDKTSESYEVFFNDYINNCLKLFSSGDSNTREEIEREISNFPSHLPLLYFQSLCKINEITKNQNSIKYLSKRLLKESLKRLGIK